MIFSLLIWGAIIFAVVRSVTRGLRKNSSWLRREVPLWEEKNIISKEQGDALLTLYKLKRAAAGKRMDMAKALTLVGAIFVGLGVIFFVGSNWQRIPSLMRTSMLLAVTLGTLYAGYAYSFEKEGFSNLGKSLLLLASLFWGGTIALIGQIYNIPTSENWYIMLLWAFPIVPLAVFYKNDYVHILASVLFVIWNFLYSGSNGAANYYYPLIVLLCMLPTANDLIVSRRINIIGLVAASFYCCFYKYEWLALMISVGLLACYLFRKQERAYLYCACLSFIFWNIASFTVKEGRLNLYFLLPIGYIFYLTYKDNIEKNLVLCLAGLMVGINLALSSFSYLLYYQFDGLRFIAFQSFFGLAVYSVGIVSRRRGYLFPVTYKISGYLVTFICVYLLAFKALLGEWEEASNSVYFFGALALAGALVLFVLNEIKSGNIKSKPERIEFTAMAAALGGSLVLLMNPQAILLNTIVMNAVLVAFALCNIFLGVELKRPRIFTLGIVIFALFIITRYIDVTWKLKEKSLFFIAGGLFILFLGTYLEKQRKKIIERMKAE
jgi:uncharacterized membrane protein